jgi:hypothetical protein
MKGPPLVERRARSTKKRCFFTPLPALPWDANMAPRRGDEEEARSMRVLLSDLVLFSCLLAFVTGIVIAVASLLS